jgi:hypothetical protein
LINCTNVGSLRATEPWYSNRQNGSCNRFTA